MKEYFYHVKQLDGNGYVADYSNVIYAKNGVEAIKQIEEEYKTNFTLVTLNKL